MSSGPSSIRGYLVQTLIALLDALRDDQPWDRVQLEPANEGNQKIDLLWEHERGKRAVQVKSSQNQINKADAERWAGELESCHAEADQLELVLIGPCAQSVIDLGHVGQVVVRPPKSLDLAGLIREAAQCLARFLEANGLSAGHADQRERLVEALVGHLAKLSAESRTLDRRELTDYLTRGIHSAPVAAGGEFGMSGRAAGQVLPYYAKPHPDVTDHEWYVQYNFHRTEHVEQLIGLLQMDSAGPRVALLTGQSGSGRRYLVQSAVFQARQEHTQLAYACVDLDGYETIEDYLRSYANHQVKKREWEAAGNELDRVLRFFGERFPLDEPSIELCTLLSIAMDVSKSLPRTHQLLQQALGNEPHDGSPSHALTALLDFVTQRSPLLVHLLDSVQATATLRHRLVRECLGRTHLVLAFSGLPDELEFDQFAGVETTRLEIDRLDKPSLRAAVWRQFAPNRFPDSLADLLWQSSRGDRLTLAWTLRRLVREELIVKSPPDVCTMATGPQASHQMASVIRESYWQPFHELIHDHPRLKQFLELGALCGENVPATLILKHLGLDDEERDALADLIDEQLCGQGSVQCFRDLAYSHPAFPEVAVYAFVDPAVSAIILDWLRPVERAQRALQFLAYLEREVPPRTRAAARIYLSLLAFLEGDDTERRRWELALAWWIGWQETEALREHLSEWMRQGTIGSAVVWRVLQMSKDRWPPYRRLALLEAYGDQAHGIPFENLESFSRMRVSLLYDVARYAEAIQFAQESLASWVPKDTFDKVYFHALIGQSQQAKGEFGPALDHFQTAVRIWERNFDRNSPGFAALLNNLASLYDATGRYEAAEPLHQQALEICRQVLGEQHPDFAQSLSNLASLYYATGRYEAAEPLYQQALEIRRQVLGEQHPHFAQSLNNLASLYCATGRSEAGEPLCQQALEICRQVLGEQHPDFASSLNNLASLYCATGRSEAAEPLYQQALEIRRQVLGEQHPDFASSLSNLAGLYEATGRYEAAEPLYQQALEVYRAVLGSDHPRTKIVQGNCDRLKQGR